MEKPRLSFWQIWNMSFGFLGIQFGFALQNSNVSRIFETLGAKIDEIPILWIAAPVTGLIIQPIIGYMSDRTWGKLGRRRPYFLAGAILSTIALFFMPNSPVLWVAAGMLWILDASINISMEPFRAFVGDNLPSSQRTSGFAMQSFFIGVGAVVASALPYMMTNWFGIANSAPEGQIPDSVKFSFYFGGAVFLTAVIYTIATSKEYSPTEMAQFSGEDLETEQSQHKVVSKSSRFVNLGLIWLFVGSALSLLFALILEIKDYGLHVLFIGSAVFGLLQILVGYFVSSQKTNGLVSVIDDLYNMPKTMSQLAIVQFFTWFALFSMWIYTTPTVTHHIFGATDSSSKLYNDGADWVGIIFSVYNGFSAIVAFLLPVIASKTSRRFVHMLSLVIGGIGLISFYFIQNPNFLIASMLGVGLAWASILSMPYAILAGSLPQKKMGVYMGIFNFFIVIPQITAASILGWFVKNLFADEAIYALVLGGISMIIAGILTLRVQDVDDPNLKA